MSYDLERFKQAQEATFATAIAELRAGGKRSHWIWYVFPQLRGLGHSGAAVRYGLDGVAEASAYLRDLLLRARYLEALAAVHLQLIEGHIPLEELMGWDIDAKKLVSSATLVEHVAGTLAAKEPDAARDQLVQIERLSREILDVAEAQGYPRCPFTLRQIGATSRDR